MCSAQQLAGTHQVVRDKTREATEAMEALQPDPTRPDALQWITSYASIYNSPGNPLYDLCLQGKAGADPRMLFSWFAGDHCTDPAFAESDEPEARANPSQPTWEDQGYLAQQKRRLPSHKYRRLHLNLPGLPDGAAHLRNLPAVSLPVRFLSAAL